jgi:hypothetical protein
VKASGHTLTVGELRAELDRADVDTPVYIGSGNKTGYSAREVDATRTAVTLTADPGSVAPDDETCTDLLRRYLRKEISAIELRKLAAEEVQT